MKCPKCGNENVSITSEQVSSKSGYKQTGCLWELGRICLIFCTCGLWCLVGKRNGTGNVKIKN